MTTWRRKTNRLPPDASAGPNAYVVTIATEGRAKCFADPAIVEACVQALYAASSIEAMRVHAYVFMSDHCHLLLAGTDEARLASFMKHFKQVTAYSYKHSHGSALWQKSYHDHVLRKEEDMEDVANYIALNPVRAGLVDSWEVYPFTGGDAFDGRSLGDLKVAATSHTASTGRTSRMIATVRPEGHLLRLLRPSSST